MEKKPYEKLMEAIEQIQKAIEPVLEPIKRMYDELGIPWMRPQMPGLRKQDRRGHPTYKWYDAAFEQLEQGVPKDLVWEWFCEMAEQNKDDVGLKDNFDRAMRDRRQKKRR